MNKKRLGFVGILLSLVFILTACATQKTSTPSTSAVTGAQSSPPSESISSATASPASNVQATSLKQAVANLNDLDSYVMTVKLTNVKGSVSATTGALNSGTLKIVRNGQDRQVTALDSNGKTIFQLWNVNGTRYADIGNGPKQISPSNVFVQQLISMYGTNLDLFNVLETPTANYKVTGTATFNGVPSNVELAQYQINSQGGMNLVFGNISGSVTSVIWVAQDGNYLMKGDFKFESGGQADVNGSAAATVTGTETSAANAGAEAVVELSQINSAPQIQAPGS